MNYKEKCGEYFKNSDNDIRRLQHRAKEMHKRHISLVEEMDKNGEEWFYFEHVDGQVDDTVTGYKVVYNE